MRVIHNLGILSTSKDVNENVGFLLTNKKGGYCSFFNIQNSRFYGLFYFDENELKMYKFIEDIVIIGHNKITSLKNGFYFFERIKDEIVESFLMPTKFNTLVYKLSSQNEIDLVLDCKESYDNREFGRYYNIYTENNCIIIEFTKKTDKREDKSDELKEFVLYLAIKSDSTLYEENNEWVEKYYSYDEERKSPPFKRYVYNVLRLKGSKFIFSMSKNKSDAIKECEYVFNNADEIKNKEREYFLNIFRNEFVKKLLQNKRISKEVKVAYVNAINSLNKLIVENKSNNGIFAGLPWFFQFWSRDVLISLKALYKINKELSKKLLFNYLNKIDKYGRLPNLIGQYKSKNLGSADSHGWLFFRCNELLEEINKNKDTINSIKLMVRTLRQNRNSNSPRIMDYLRKCNLILHKKQNDDHKVLYEIETSLEKSLNGLLKFYTKNVFEINNKLETWMDTEFENDAREGSRIEVQALRLNIYKLLFELTLNQKYKILKNTLKIKIKNKFWNEIILADGLNDFTIRPNMFIAAYVCPELLKNNEWEICFNNALKSLWLDWGGLSTIDKKNPLFTDTYTGEDIKSYHRGDSWFWINNLTALTLFNINKIKFNNQIKKIIEASTEEILWKGCIGCHAELSSAKELQSRGCFNQAWSNAMFIEMIDDVFG